jgi:FkbM family methyltransferase
MGKLGRFVERVWAFPKKSSHEKLSSYASRWDRLFPGTPAPIRLPIGAWWLMDKDYLGQCITNGGYENEERMFIGRFVRPGMTVLDIGAHRGVYTLLLSKMVGRKGRVLSFEPSSGNNARLKLHLRINFCHNVDLKECALGKETGVTNLYVVPSQTVLNSLRPPDTNYASSAMPVQIRTLDEILSAEKISRVDFVKLDVEGGELDVLLGAENLLRTVPRPIFLCEVLEKRTRPWGYSSRLIIDHLIKRDFEWFQLNASAELYPLQANEPEFSGNFVAVPRESLNTVRHLLLPEEQSLPTTGPCGDLGPAGPHYVGR